ncbi:substrate-binding domain-containing protein [Streptomyces lasiicapitis]|uniref:PBP domain-containing protein n=1 Tax=Streptomyces lasiicapitis TaxID=1923961 RepID=A0ABQ2LIE0_9ACTN|nr:substrate-binding domain-containing protein [Streptomyces lasiicapitis]GGO35132.1 hypothetical protein GCM10012286_05350 [Streptomyces lasiicapitis]
MNVKSRVRIGAVVGAAALGLGVLTAPSAMADPTGFPTLAGTGSDTTQDVTNAIATRVGGSPQLIGSWDATGTSPIKTRATGCSLPRPNGSSAGIDALRADLDANTKCLDFARSSRGPADRTSTRLTWVPFAKDAVTFAVRSDSALRTADLTPAQLKSVFNCTTKTLNGVTLTPLLPQAQSGSRTFFLGQIGLPEAEVGSCVGSMQEHDGRALDSAGDIAPYSVAQWIAQTNEVVPDIHGVTVLNKVGGVAPTTAGKLNPAFPFARDVFNVVPTAKLNDATVKDVFVGSTSKVCAQNSTIETYGFGSLGTGCGATSDPALKGER